MGKFHQLVHGKYADSTAKPAVEPTINYVDRPIETTIYVDRPVDVIKYVEVPVEKIVERMLIEYKTVEVPVMYEKIVDRPIEVIKEVIREVTPKVIDITDHLSNKRQAAMIKRLKAALVLSLIANLIILVVR